MAGNERVILSLIWNKPEQTGLRMSLELCHTCSLAFSGSVLSNIRENTTHTCPQMELACEFIECPKVTRKQRQVSLWRTVPSVGPMSPTFCTPPHSVQKSKLLAATAQLLERSESVQLENYSISGSNCNAPSSFHRQNFRPRQKIRGPEAEQRGQ